MKKNNIVFMSLAIAASSFFNLAFADTSNQKIGSSYYTFKDAGLGKNYIYSITSASGKIYIATADEMFIKSMSEENFDEYFVAEGAMVNQVYGFNNLTQNIAVDAYGIIYAAGNSPFFTLTKSVNPLSSHKYYAFRYESFKRIFSFYEAPSIPQNSVVTDNRGMVYIGTNNGLLFMKKSEAYYNPFSSDLYTFINILKNKAKSSELEVHGLYADDIGSIYVGTKGQGLYVLNSEIKRNTNNLVEKEGVLCAGDCSSLKHFNITSQDDNYTIVNIYVDKQDVIYLGTNKGLFIGNKNNDGEYSFIEAGVNSVISNAPIQSLYVDAAGIIYVGTVDGLVIGEKNSKGEYYFTTVERSTFNANDIRSLYVDPNGKIYVGTSEGLYVGTKSFDDR